MVIEINYLAFASLGVFKDAVENFVVGKEAGEILVETVLTFAYVVDQGLQGALFADDALGYLGGPSHDALESGLALMDDLSILDDQKEQVPREVVDQRIGVVGILKEKDFAVTCLLD